MNLSAVGVTARDGGTGAAATVSETAPDTGLLDAPPAETSMLPVHGRAGEIDTERVEGAVPDVAERVNQDALAVALQASVPVPLLVIWIDCAEGTAPPAV